eukprot:TRINITY_DN50309_c0_g1_i1.p1 TRINITY_DN50309_c0_g1~~TRINITY_DN50309_c0_g1_i1.p1  ORF type:complete len:145 (-),score=25.12 TRINITY_DN50309_c0_g1_i1:193-627(-)
MALGTAILTTAFALATGTAADNAQCTDLHKEGNCNDASGCAFCKRNTNFGTCCESERKCCAGAISVTGFYPFCCGPKEECCTSYITGKCCAEGSTCCSPGTAVSDVECCAADSVCCIPPTMSSVKCCPKDQPDCCYTASAIFKV